MAVYGGWSFASASSGIFDFVREELTVGGRDFDAPMVGIDLSYDINPRIAAALRFEYGKASVRSEFREWVDQDDNPIEQTSELMKIPLTGNMKVYLSPRGREISRYAWIPYSVAPYVGGGGGVIYYRFEQYGDFVDFDDLSIFSDRFQSSGWALIVQAFGGVDIKLHRRFFLNIEAGYGWAEAELSQDFVDFDPIDLAGFRISGGINVLL